MRQTLFRLSGSLVAASEDVRRMAEAVTDFDAPEAAQAVLALLEAQAASGRALDLLRQLAARQTTPTMENAR